MANHAERLLAKKTPPPDARTVQSWQSQMRQAVFEALDADAIRDVVGAMVEKAKKGDIQAARLLLTYAVGSPTVHVKNAVIVQEQDAMTSAVPLPAVPSRGLPRTDLKFVDMEKRAANGQPIFDPRDVSLEDD